MPLRIEPVDAQHPQYVAMMQGPLALFATGDRFQPYRREQLLSLHRAASAETGWLLAADGTEQIFKPWFALGTEPSRLYQRMV
jgi:uncharacterized protein